MRNDDNWIQTFTGRRFWPLDPAVEDVCIEDIAHALAMKCRFTGHCKSFYSVAQHSVLVSNICPPNLAMVGLLHDSAEAYFADIATPVKQANSIFRQIEDVILDVIGSKFGFTLSDVASIKQWDRIAFTTERRDVMGPPPRPYVDRGFEPLPNIIIAIGPEESERLFLERYYELT